MNKEKWKWLFQPLGRANRARLELTLGVVVSAAATVVLSTAVHADPSKIRSKVLTVPSSADRDTEPLLAPSETPAPSVPPELAEAVANGDVARVEAIFKPKMPLVGMLGVAAEAGHKPMIQWLLDHGADVHEDEVTVNAPVLLGDAHPDVVAFLRERGEAEPPMTSAALAGAPNAVHRLLAAHASLDERSPSPLTAAVQSPRATHENKMLIIDALLAAGVDPNVEEAQSALSAAVQNCSGGPETNTAECMSVVKVLVKHKAHTKGDALVSALALDDALRDEALDTLLAAPIEPGATAIALASMWGPPPKVLKRLVGKGVDWAWHDGENDAALPVLAAVQRADRDFVRALLEAGAPADVHYKDATSALGEAINGAANGGSADYARIVEVLLAHGADVNRRLPDGRTPLFAAAETGDLRILTALLDRGARVNELVLDDTALDAAEQHGQQAAARVLHSRGGRRARPVRFDP